MTNDTLGLACDHGMLARCCEVCEMQNEITALRAEVERLTSLYNGRMSDLHAVQDREVSLQSRLDEAIHRIKDMLEDDDGQAFKEAGKFLLRIKGHDHE